MKSYCWNCIYNDGGICDLGITDDVDTMVDCNSKEIQEDDFKDVEKIALNKYYQNSKGV